MARKVAVTINGKEYVSAESKKAGDSLNNLGKVSDKVNAAIKAGFIAAAAAVTASVAAMVKGVQSTAELTDNIDKMSQKIGISRQAFQEWDFILSQNGMEVSQLQTSVKTLASAAEEASRGVITYSRSFDALGVSVTDTDGQLRDQEDLLFATIDALTKVENTTKRTALATDLFGRSATELAPLLNSGSDSIEELRDKAHDLGLVLSNETVDAGVAWTDTMDQMKRTFKAVIAEGLTPVMGNINELGQTLLEQMKDGGGLHRFISGFVNFVSWTVNTGLPILHEGFTFLGGVVGVLADNLMNALSRIWDSFDNIPVLKDLKARIETYIEMSGDIWQALRDGDMTRFWSLVAPIIQDGLAIAATISLAGIAGSAIWGGIQTILGGTGFITKALGVSGAIAGISLAVAISDQIMSGSGDWGAFAANVGAAIAGAFAVGVVTGNPSAGFMTFTMLLNLKLGEVLLGKGLPEHIQTKYTQSIIDSTQNISEEALKEIEGIAKSVEWVFGKYQNATDKLVAIYKTDVGGAILAGLGIGLEDIYELGKASANDLLFAFMDALGINSPSKEGDWVGRMWAEGIAQGMDNASIWAMIIDAFKERISNLKDIGTIDPDEIIGDITGAGSGAGKSYPISERGGLAGSGGRKKTSSSGFMDLLKNIGGTVGEFIGGISGAVGSLSSFQAVLSPLQTIIQGVMDVLGPAIDSILQPVIGVFRIIGQTVGKILLPIFETLGDVVELLAKGFVWFYNKAIVPVANFFIRAFNGVANTLISIVNGIINLINKIPGVNINRLNLRDENQGTLQSISYEDLARTGAASASSYAGGSAGSNTSVQQMNINIYQYYNAPVIGDGGMEQVGGFVVRAIKEYTGIGGTVKLVEAGA